MDQLPSWDALKTHYPNVDAGTVFTDIGGKVGLNYDMGVFKNACATRVSKALNGVGGVHSIPFFKAIGPNGKHEAQVSSGRHRQWYIFRVKMLVRHLTAKYGGPERYLPSNYKAQLAGRKGIIVFEVSGWSDATGHADLWDGGKCLYQDYGGQANRVLFWEASK